MLRTVLKTVLNKEAIKTSKIISSQLRLFASFRNRDFSFETSDGEGSSSLITRFARHITIKNAESKDIVKYDIQYSDYFPINDPRSFNRQLAKVPTDQLTRMVIFTSLYKCRTEIPIICEVINILDNECARRIDEMSFQRVIELLNAFMFFLPNKIVQLDFYQAGMRKLLNEFSEKNNMQEFVELCFYLGMWKKSRFVSEQMDHLLKSFLHDYLSQLTTIDVAIVSNAAFKTSVRINNIQFHERLQSEILNMKELDVSLLVTLIKSCRHNQIKLAEILNKLKAWIEEGAMDKVDIRGIVHLLAYVAECRVTETNLVSNLVEKGFKLVKPNVRVKDLSTLLWSCAHLGLEFDRDTQLNRIANIAFKKLEKGEYKYASDELVDTCLSLWMLGYKSTEMAETALQDVQRIRKNDSRVKLDSRRILLKTCLDLEGTIPGATNNKALVPKLADNYLVVRRSDLQTTMKALTSLKDQFNIKSLKYVQQINELNIAGILIETNSNEKTYVEVLDQSNTLSDKKTPFGLMKLKLRILENYAPNTIVINPSICADETKLVDTVRQKLESHFQETDEVNTTKTKFRN